MKKIFMTLALVLTFMVGFSQVLTIQLAFGAKGVDSLTGAQTKYYYVKTAGSPLTVSGNALKDYYVYAIQTQTTRAAVLTGTDSCHVWIEVSNNNSNWVKLPGATTTVKTVGGGVYLITDDFITTTTNGGGMFLATNYYPYVRVAFQHYKASCTMYPTAWVVLKKF